jgi:lactate racemase
MRLEMPYGADSVPLEIPWGRCIGTLDIADVAPLADIEGAVREALRRPIGLDQGLRDTFRPSETVAIVVSDSFRKTAIDQVLPTLISELNAAGVDDEAISFVFASGTHRAPRPDEQAQILGPAVYGRFKARAFNHDCDDEANLVHVGDTSRGTPVFINRRVVESDRVIATGAVVLHYFGGFGGGRKSIVPGVSGRATISHNHAMNLDPTDDRLNPAVRIGAMDGNPVAEDMLEGTRFVNVDLIVNTVVNRSGAIAQVFVGELEAAHRAAAEFAHGLFGKPIAEQADVVIASSGTTKNFVQSHKALYNAYQAVRPKGRIVLLARCEEGLGSESFQRWVRLGSREAIIAGLRKQSEINGQTALSTVQKAPITVLITDLAESDTAMLGARKAVDVNAALALVQRELAGAGVAEPTYYIMPSAAYTVPILKNGEL